jgi:hypothetical protein
LVLLYASVAALWILVSDKAVEWLIGVPSQAALASTAKGMAFVAVTSALLYGLLRRLPGKLAPDGTSEFSARSLALPAGMLGLLVLALAALGISYTLSSHKARAVARLQAIADLKEQHWCVSAAP